MKAKSAAVRQKANGASLRAPRRQKLVMIGNGMAGVACLEQILRHKPPFDVTVFGDETYPNYNRIALSAVLAGDKRSDEIVLNDISWYLQHGISVRLGLRVTEIDPKKRRITADDGSSERYDKLIIATGSSAIVPRIPGIEGKTNVFVFRTINDTKGMLACCRQGARAVVIGGGLLGLEAARGLQMQGCDVTVVHLMPTLMERQLDTTGGEYLQRKIEALGVRVKTSCQTTAIHGTGKLADSVEFADGEVFPADIVVVAAGIRPNAELGRHAGLEVGRGIVVNDHLETSDPNILAVGECTEHRGTTYGLVGPLLEQGKVLASVL
ncbi:MAG TPA: FAD-dependent oxidoreductase, partial [Bryobacteraceae bacterium]|nr:FAD-dependent oxidoreductase [Bryobacteraceae bacterium]